MKNTLMVTFAAMVVAGSSVALADGGHGRHGFHGPATATPSTSGNAAQPNAAQPNADQRHQRMNERHAQMAERHARMEEHHRNAQSNSSRQRDQHRH